MINVPTKFQDSNGTTASLQHKITSIFKHRQTNTHRQADSIISPKTFVLWVYNYPVAPNDSPLSVPSDHKGMFACFFHGLANLLLDSTSKSLQICRLVVLGSIMSSTNPRKI